MLDSTVLVALGGLALLCLLLAVSLLRTRGRGRRDLAAARAETASLRRRVEELERRLSAPEKPPARTRPRYDGEYTITGLGTADGSAPVVPTSPAPRLDQALFADLVLRETVVRAASLAHGVRRALAPEVRNRVRFEVRREIRRARKQRRADLREARREWEARQRAGLDDGPATESDKTESDKDENAA